MKIHLLFIFYVSVYVKVGQRERRFCIKEVITWQKIGSDVILVDVPFFSLQNAEIHDKVNKICPNRVKKSLQTSLHKQRNRGSYCCICKLPFHTITFQICNVAVSFFFLNLNLSFSILNFFYSVRPTLGAFDN